MKERAPRAPEKRGRLVVLSGPSGCGKSSICRAIARFPGVEFSVSATTRPPRPGETDGVDYRFVTPAAFDRLVAKGAFAEWARVHGHRYGTLRAPLEHALRRGRTFLVEIDVQGAAKLQRNRFEGTYVFVKAPSLAELRRRLRARGTDDPASIARRLRKAREEMRHAPRYDHVIVNDDLSRAIAEVRSILGLRRPAGRSGRGCRVEGSARGRSARA